MPVTGTVMEVNPALEANPALVNEDPYGEGWMIKVKLDAGADLSGLMDAVPDLIDEMYHNEELSRAVL
jgi:glycine cleavage system H protein